MGLAILNGMSKLKHTGDFNRCLTCYRRYTEENGDSFPALSYYRQLHNRAVTRQEREQALRDCGLVKARGALGGTYWE